MLCPSCGDAAVADDGICARCGFPPPVEAGAAADVVAEAGGARLGRFHKAAAPAVIEFAVRRDALTDVVRGEGEVEVRVPAERRDALRAELVLIWESLVETLDLEEQRAVRSAGGLLPGWQDAPDGVWVDRYGRLQVARSQEEAEEDQSRLLGPALAAAGLMLWLFAWYVGEGRLRLLAFVCGLALILVGTFLPR